MPTPKAIELAEKVKMIDCLLLRGVTPFQAIAATLEDDDWLLILVAFKDLVIQANK